MKRFAYVCGDPGVPVPGQKGASVHIENVCRAFRRLGLKGDVFALTTTASNIADCPLHPIPLADRRKRKSKEERESRLFLSSVHSSLGLGEYDFIYERYSLWHTGGLSWTRKRGVPFILEVNSPLPREASEYRSLANQALAQGIAQLLLREADGIVCVSEEVAAWVAELRGHREEVWVVPNGVDERMFAPRPESRPEPLPPPGVPLIGFCGSFRPWHGVMELLDAFRLVRRDVPNAELVCVGDGPLRGPFEEKARDLGLADVVHLPGQLPQDRVSAYLGGATVAVAPYPVIEDYYFSPLKLYEFMALGLPVVASSIGQIPLVVRPGEYGWLSEPGSPESLAENLLKVLRDPAGGVRMGRAARQWILSEATWNHRVGQILQGIEALPCRR